MRRLESRVIAFYHSNRLLIALRLFAINQYFGRILHGHVKLQPVFVDGYGVGPVQRVQFAFRHDIALRIAGKYNHPVACVGFDRIDVAILLVNIEAVVVLDVRIAPLDDPLRLGHLSSRRRAVQTVENSCGPQVVVLKDDFIGCQIDSHRRVSGIRIRQRAELRRTSYLIDRW